VGAERGLTTAGAKTASYDVSPDGSRFVMVQDQNRDRPRVIHVVFDWPEALLRDVAAMQ